MHRSLRGSGIVLLAVALAATTPAASPAQACAGLATPRGQSSAGAALVTAQRMTGYGLRFARNYRGDLALGLEYTHLRYRRERFGDEPPIGPPAANVVGGELVYAIPGIGIPLCTTYGVRYARSQPDEQDQTRSRWIVPLGVGVGHTLPLTAGLAATPYAQSHLLTAREGARESYEQEIFFNLSLSLGLVLSTRRVNAGVTVEHFASEDPLFIGQGGRPTNRAISLHAGLIF